MLSSWVSTSRMHVNVKRLKTLKESFDDVRKKRGSNRVVSIHLLSSSDRQHEGASSWGLSSVWFYCQAHQARVQGCRRTISGIGPRSNTDLRFAVQLFPAWAAQDWESVLMWGRSWPLQYSTGFVCHLLMRLEDLVHLLNDTRRGFESRQTLTKMRTKWLWCFETQLGTVCHRLVLQKLAWPRRSLEVCPSEHTCWQSHLVKLDGQEDRGLILLQDRFHLFLYDCRCSL